MFIYNQKVSIIVKCIAIKIENITYAGLLQKLLLYFIVYLFSNANLVYSIINKNKKSIIFINDYIA